MKLPMRMRPAVLFSIVVAVVVAVGGTSAAEDMGGGWLRTRTENGIVVARKEVPGSPFVAFRGEGDVDQPLLLVGSVLVDTTRGREWIDSLVETRILRTVSETEYVTWSHIGTPITMKDREFVTSVSLSVDTGKKQLSIRMHSVDDPAAPRTDYVRGELTDSSWTLTSIGDGSKTHVVAEIHCDPKGSIAAWIVNMFQNNWGYNTLKSLRAQVKKPDIRIHPRLKTVLEEKGFFN
jgi:hypothetical protein